METTYEVIKGSTYIPKKVFERGQPSDIEKVKENVSNGILPRRGERIPTLKW